MKVIMIDGNSIINRAFYGIRLFSNREGLYTNAVYGFINILLKLIEEEKPDGVCVAFDVHAPTLRSQKYDQYKAHRKEMPGELAVQLPVMRTLLDAMKIPYFELAGYEADDLLGTLCAELERLGGESVVVTGDRDSLQLVSDLSRVKLVTTSKGQTLTTDYTPDVFKDEYGFDPINIIDLKALMGDASDNIPGVPGVGKVTATDLIKRFKTIAHIYENIDSPDIKETVRKKLIAGKEMADLSYDLATIDRAVPVDIHPEDLKLEPFDRAELYKLFVELEFKSLIDKFGISESENGPDSGDTPQNYEEIRLNPDNYREIIASVTGQVAASCGQNLSTFAFGCGGRVYMADEDSFSQEEYYELLTLFGGEQVKKVGNNIKDDIKQLMDRGITPGGYEFDTALCAYLLNPTEGSYSIERLGLSYLSRELPPENVGAHVIAIEDLYKILKDTLDRTDMTALYYDLELPLCTVLAKMEHTGMMVDSAKLEAFSDQLSGEIERISSSIFSHSGYEFNINSTAQLGKVIFDELGLPPAKKTKTGYSTSIDVLERLKGKHPIIEEIIEYRQLTKLKSTYCDGLLKVIEDDGRIHTKFNMMVTATGRRSSAEPNLQNIPIRQDLGSEIRKMFVSKEGFVLVDADYSQIELRILAHISGDRAMIDAFKGGEDIHTITASQVFGVPPEEVSSELRRRAKAVNFGIVYGISDFSLGEDIGVTRAEAKKYIESYLNHYSGVRQYMSDVVEDAREHGFVKTILNRLRYLPELKSKNFNIRSFGERAALNTPIQGSAADVIKMAMLKVESRLERDFPEARLILQVHDELIVESPAEFADQVAKALTEEMQNVLELKLPLVAEASIGKTWYDAKG